MDFQAMACLVSRLVSFLILFMLSLFVGPYLTKGVNMYIVYSII